VLQAREQLLQDLFSEARSRISELSADEGRYVQLLQGTVLEVRYYFSSIQSTAQAILLIKAMLRILEPEVSVIVQKTDEILAMTAVDNAARQYTEISGREIKPTVEPSLSNDSYDDAISTLIH